MNISVQLLEYCAIGDLNAVKIVAESSGFDVNATATHYYGPAATLGINTIEWASPLFVAAGNCNFEIVKYLIEKGANVNYIPPVENARAFRGMSPLHAAVSLRTDFEFQRRKPVIELLISNGADPSALTGPNKLPFWTICSTKEANVTILLVESGMNLKERCPCSDRTILHHWASSSEGPPAQEAVSVVDLLLAKGTDLKALDQDGLSPLNIAAIGYLRHQTLARPNELLLRFLLGRQEFDLMDKINALELAGAMILLHSYRENNALSDFGKAFEYWNEALDLRISGSIPKVSLNLSNNVYWRTVEWTNRDQIEELKQRPADAKLFLQAILVAHRIFSRTNSKALEFYLWNGFVYTVFSRLRNNKRNAELLEVCWIMLEGARSTNVRFKNVWMEIVGIDIRLVESLKNLKDEKSPMLTSEVLKLSLELVIDENRFKLIVSDEEDSRSIELLHEEILKLLPIISESPSELVTSEIKRCLHQFVKRDERDQ